MRPLTGPGLENARDALINGYFSWAELEQLAAFALDINLEAEVGKGALKNVAFDLLKLTESQGWTEILLRDAASRKPGNIRLSEFARLHALAPAPFSEVDPMSLAGAAALAARGGSGGFEAHILKNSGLLSTGAWRKCMVQCEHKVCQILCKEKAIGTGFLVAPDLVITNWHVFEFPPDSGKLGVLGDYAARFDYRASDEENVAEVGTVVPFDAVAGYLDHSHKLELDYVLVQLTQKLGEQKLISGESRGWLALGTREFEANETTIILQHPACRTLELSPGTVIGWVAQKRGEIYEHLADTEDGSSGSPCFSPSWTLLALHHRVDPVTGDRNRAIATPAILARMGNVGSIGLLPRV